MPSRAKVSRKGQVTLPAAIRVALGFTPGTTVQIELRGAEIVLSLKTPVSADARASSIESP